MILALGLILVFVAVVLGLLVIDRHYNRPIERGDSQNYTEYSAPEEPVKRVKPTSRPPTMRHRKR